MNTGLTSTLLWSRNPFNCFSRSWVVRVSWERYRGYHARRLRQLGMRRSAKAERQKRTRRDFAPISVVFIFVFLFLLASSRHLVSSRSPLSAIRRRSKNIVDRESRRLRRTSPIDVTRATLRNPARRPLTFVDRRSQSCTRVRTHDLRSGTHARLPACLPALVVLRDHSYTRSVLPLAVENDISRRAGDARRPRTHREERRRAAWSRRLRKERIRSTGPSSSHGSSSRGSGRDNGNLELDDVG